MEARKRILIILTTQFGYHTDTYMYCKYIDRSKYSISYICFDMGFLKLELPDTQVIYIRLLRNKLIRYLNFSNKVRKAISSGRFDLVFHVHTKFTLLVRIFNIFSPMTLDIRTGDLNDFQFIREIRNLGISLNAAFYPSISVISESLANRLKIPFRKRVIIPLGGELQPTNKKDFKKLRLLYVGTLDKRNIHETVKGISTFLEHNNDVDIKYDIVGDGNRSSKNNIISLIKRYNLQDNVTYHGRKNFDDLKLFFEKNNVGIVFIPKRPYYNFQPSTKLYECLLAGMPVIATDTFENRKVIMDETGILCDDNHLSFAEALEKLYNRREIYNSELIKNNYLNSTWENIVRNSLEPFFEREINHHKSIRYDKSGSLLNII